MWWHECSTVCEQDSDIFIIAWNTTVKSKYKVISYFYLDLLKWRAVFNCLGEAVRLVTSNRFVFWKYQTVFRPFEWLDLSKYWFFTKSAMNFKWRKCNIWPDSESTINSFAILKILLTACKKRWSSIQIILGINIITPQYSARIFLIKQIMKILEIEKKYLPLVS